MADEFLINVDEVARRLSLSRSKLYAMNSTGELGPKIIKVGRRSLLNVKELELWVNAGLPSRSEWKNA